MPSSDVERQAIVQNSIHYLKQHIEQHKKVGLKKDNYLERRLKIQDITKIILKSLPKDQLTDNTKLEHIVFEMMTIPIITVGSVEEKLTEKSIRDCFKKLDIKPEQNKKNISIYIESDEDFSKLTEDQIEFYKEYIRLNR